MSGEEPVDLVQDVTSDCSVVASLCAATARAERGHSKIIFAVIYPFDRISMRPSRSQNGKYIFRLNFNGCWRKVVIDDRLPTSSNAKTLHVVDRNNPGLLWPALVEKAYLKIRGGYDFPGSNSGLDLWILTGWIPEQLFLRSDNVEQESLWHRLVTADKFGDVLITLGTGKLTEKEEKSTGLVSEHDFAVLRLREQNGRKMLLVKNPWSEGNGRVITDDSADMENATREEYINNESVELLPSVSKTMAEKHALEPGKFWMNLNDIFQHFESMYLNWNPELFSHREDIHFIWDVTEANGRWASFANNPQFEISNMAGGIVWLVLNRHFNTVPEADNNLSKDVSNTDLAESGFISLYVFRNSGHRVCLTDGAILHGPYVDSPNTLVKLDTERAQSYIVVVSVQELSQSSHRFTLTGFSRDSLSIAKARDRYSNRITRRGAWTALTAGGNASSSSYTLNQQFRIQLHQQSDISLLLEVESGDLPVHVKLVRASRKSVTFVSTQDVIGDSGEYRKGHALAEIPNVAADAYRVICSTFEQGQLGRFTLQVGTMTDCIVERVSAAPAGQFISHAPRAFFRPGVDRLGAQYRCGRLTRVTLIARSFEDKTKSTSKGTSVPLKISLEHGQGRKRQVLAVSGNDEFTNGHYGIQVDDVDLQPWMFDRGCVWIALERAGPSDFQSLEAVDVEVFSDAPGEIGMWHEDF